MNNDGPVSSGKRNIFKFSKDHWIAVIGIITGLVIAMVIPFWEAYFVQTPSLAIEINGISREISDDAGISLQDYPELSSLNRTASTRVIRRVGSSGSIIVEEDGRIIRRVIGEGKGLVSPETLNEMLNSAKEELRQLPERVEKAKEKLEEVKKYTPETLKLTDVSRLNGPLFPEVDVEPKVFNEKREDLLNNKPYFENILKDFVSRYSSELSSVEERYTELQTNLATIERKIETLVTELKKKKSFFRISAVLANSGQSSISIKRPALLRVYIGTGNYVDLKMKLENYQDTAEVSAHGTRIASFKSDEISTIPDEDQSLINTYWGQSVHAILFTEDILGHINASNPIAFSEGLYQKIIYDRLEGEASNKKYFVEQ